MNTLKTEKKKKRDTWNDNMKRKLKNKKRIHNTGWFLMVGNMWIQNWYLKKIKGRNLKQQC